MAISVVPEPCDRCTLIRLAGRLDAHGAAEAEPLLGKLDTKGVAVLGLDGVGYLSSAGVRIFVALHKAFNSRGGRLILAGLQPYCREVLKISGLEQFFTVFDTVEAALSEVGPNQEVRQLACGKFVFHKGSEEAGTIEVLGHIEDVLASRVTADHVRNRKFSAKEFSLGLGALGPSVEEVLPIMGEMMTMGGTMVWLPTDGNDTPDFLVPHQDSSEVVIRTGFNASLKGRFNEYIEFESAHPEGATLAEIYRSLFDLARQRRPDYRGALGLALRAEVGKVFGSGVVKSPVASNAPANGKWITDAANFSEWFESDEAPRHLDVTGLICGVGVDLQADLSGFDQDFLKATFYLNPGNQGDSSEKLHNHGVFFSPFPLGEKPWSLEREVQSVVEGGTFLDMRHLYDSTTIVWALIGVVYVQDFCPDSSAAPSD